MFDRQIQSAARIAVPSLAPPGPAARAEQAARLDVERAGERGHDLATFKVLPARVGGAAEALWRNGWTIQRSAAPVTAAPAAAASSTDSSFEDTKTNQSGQIYGIWKNEQSPGKINEATSITDAKCLYVGKTSRGDDFGARFVEHARDDAGKPWADAKLTWDEHDDEVWPYVPRNLWKYNGVTKFDVAVAEQYYIDRYRKAGAPLLNKDAAITAAKFDQVLAKNPNVWTTKAGYKGYKPAS